MRVLITGGFGFLGGRLGQLLTGRGHDVVLGSRNDAAAPAWLPSARVARTDWESPSALERACEKVDAVVHLAGMNAPDSAADPVRALAANGDATGRLVDAATRQQVKRFVYLSTAHVYGKLEGTITEDTVTSGVHPYATSHLAGEQAVLAANQSRAMRGTVIRLTNAYGAPAHPDVNCWMLLMNDLCRQAATAGVMALTSSGLQRRNLIPMHDACRAIEHLMTLSPDRPAPDVVNVGSSWAPTVLVAATMVSDRCVATLGFKPPLSHAEARADEATAPLDYRSDALAATGFTATADHAGEIDRLLVFCRGRLRAEVVRE